MEKYSLNIYAYKDKLKWKNMLSWMGKLSILNISVFPNLYIHKVIPIQYHKEPFFLKQEKNILLFISFI